MSKVDTQGNKNYKKKANIKDKMIQKINSFQGSHLASKLVNLENKTGMRTKAKYKNKRADNWSKGGNYTDLLGFGQYEDAPFDAESGYGLNDLEYVHLAERPARRKTSKAQNFTTHQHVQANHRFVLKPNHKEDYLLATYDADHEVKWERLFMVHAKRNAEYICPICREDSLVAPRISK